MNTEYCLKEERGSDRKREIQLMDHTIIDCLNTGIYLPLTEMHINHHHHFYSGGCSQYGGKMPTWEDVTSAKECTWPSYPVIITHTRWSSPSKWVNEISDFTQLRKELLIPLWGGNPISSDESLEMLYDIAPHNGKDHTLSERSLE